MQTLGKCDNYISNICDNSAAHEGAEEKVSDIRDIQTLIKIIYKEIKRSAMKHGINGQNMERFGWYILACEEYGKRDGLLQAVKIIEDIVEGKYHETIL